MLLFVFVVVSIALVPHADDASTSPGLNVSSFGAKGDGRTDDTAAFGKALAAAARSKRRLYVPAGVYLVRRLRLSDGVSLKGASSRTTWLKGHIEFGSGSAFTDLKIGDSGSSAIHNLAGATGTTFTRCHFRGGGGATPNQAVVALGYKNSCDGILFKDCEVERNLGVDASLSEAYNNISIYSQTAAPRNITFDGCHIGVFNGVATGSPRMGVECWVQNGSAGWFDLTFRNCVFEPTFCHNIDLADSFISGSVSRNVLIEGCTLKGAGADGGHSWTNNIDIECPDGVVIRNNTFYRSYLGAIAMSHMHSTGPGAIITGNVFDFSYNNGITPKGSDPFTLSGYDNVFTGNTVICNYGSGIVDLAEATNNTVTGNTFVVGSSYGNPVIKQWGGSGNITSPNTVSSL